MSINYRLSFFFNARSYKSDLVCKRVQANETEASSQWKQKQLSYLPPT